MSSPVKALAGSRSLEAAREVFWKLGKDRIWKQIIDGRFHRYTQSVFDLGLHRRDRREPGFLQSALNGFDYVDTILCEPLTLEQYQKINQIMCAHFEKGQGSMLMSKEEAGTFRTSECYCSCSASIFDEIDKTTDERIQKIANLNLSLELTANELKRPSFAQIFLETTNHDEKRMCIRFYPTNVETQEANIRFLIDRYNSQMAAANRSLEQTDQDDERDSLMDHKFDLIADFFKTLEALHPFHDGQTRSDIALLTKLLSEEGFNPPILDDPNVSVFLSKEAWRNYLNKGMKVWALDILKNSQASTAPKPKSYQGPEQPFFNPFD